ncbi:hypothetical protein RFI_28141, partial [Reticulomyxa filosa]
RFYLFWFNDFLFFVLAYNNVIQNDNVVRIKCCLYLWIQKIVSFDALIFKNMIVNQMFFSKILYYPLFKSLNNKQKNMFHIFVFLTKNKKDINSTLNLLFLCITYCHLKQLISKVNNINEMGNRNTTHFQILKELHTPLSQSQCVLHKHELLICGGHNQRACYSYHKLKNEYKFICEYPSHVRLWGHCVVKLVDNDKDNNQITLLSFGSDYNGENKHTLVMKY